MQLKPYDSKISVQCFIQFDGCEPETVDRQEQRAALHAAVITKQPCWTWDASDLCLPKQRYEPGSDLSTNVAKHIAKHGLSERAKELAQQMETCGIHAAADSLPVDLKPELNWTEGADPCVTFDDFMEIYPEYSGVSLSRLGRFTYNLICAQTGASISEHKTMNEALVAATVEIMRHRAAESLGMVEYCGDVPESRGF